MAIEKVMWYVTSLSYLGILAIRFKIGKDQIPLDPESKALFALVANGELAFVFIIVH